MKKIILFSILYFFFSFSLLAQCWVSNLVSDIENGSTEFKAFIKSNPEGLNSYKYLNTSDPNLTSNLNLMQQLSADLAHPTYGPEISQLFNENIDDVKDIWKRLKEEPSYSWEIRKTGGSRWEKWAQREFFKVITKKGKDFEELVCEVAFSNRSSAKYLELKEKFQTDFGKDLDEYEMFGQVQLKFNNDGDYFIADQVFIKFDELENVEDLLVLENKLSQSTPFTGNQTEASQIASYNVRSNSKESLTSPGTFLTNDSQISFSQSQQWYKISSDGTGALISSIQKID